MRNIKLFEEFMSESNDAAMRDALSVAGEELRKWNETYPEDKETETALASVVNAKEDGAPEAAMRDSLQEAYDELVKWFKSFPDDEDLPAILKTIEAALGIEPLDTEDTD